MSSKKIHYMHSMSMVLNFIHFCIIFHTCTFMSKIHIHTFTWIIKLLKSVLKHPLYNLRFQYRTKFLKINIRDVLSVVSEYIEPHMKEEFFLTVFFIFADMHAFFSESQHKGPMKCVNEPPYCRNVFTGIDQELTKYVYLVWFANNCINQF